MKLNDLKPPVQLQANHIYQTFTSLLLKVFGTEDNTLEDRVNADFFENLFHGAATDPDLALAGPFPGLPLDHLPENAVDLLRFVSGEIKDRRIALVGGVGWGKSTLLHYTLSWLPHRYPQAFAAFGPLIIDFNILESKFWRNVGHATDPPSLYRFIRSVILSKIKESMAPYLPAGNEFRDLVVSSPQFASYLPNFLAGGDDPSSPVAGRTISSFLDSDDYPGFLLWAWRRVRNQTPVFALDNVDLMPACLHEALAVQAAEMAAEWDCRVILVVRSFTWAEVVKKIDHLKFLQIPLVTPDIASIVSRRLAHYAGGAQSFAPRSVASPAEKQASFTHGDSVHFVRSLLETLIQQEETPLALLSNFNIRHVMQYIRLYLSTPHARNLPPPPFAPGALAGVVGAFPDHLFVRSILSAGLSGYTSSMCTAPTVTNIFDAGAPRHLINHFIRSYVLLVLGRHGQGIRRSGIRGIIATIFSGLPDIADLCNRSVLSLIRSELIFAARMYKIPVAKLEADKPTLGPLVLSYAGRYYVSKLIWCFPYLLFVKDDASLDMGPRPGWLRVVADCEGLSDELKAVYEFVLYLHQTEMALLDKVVEGGDVGRCHYREYLRLDRDTCLLTLRMAEEIHRVFGIGYRSVVDHLPDTRLQNLVGNLLSSAREVNSRYIEAGL